jgi:hypothetical protein
MKREPKRYIICGTGTSSIGILQRVAAKAADYRKEGGDDAPIISLVAFDCNAEISQIETPELRVFVVGRTSLAGDGSGMDIDLGNQAFAEDRDEIKALLMGTSEMQKIPIGGAIIVATPGVGASATTLCPNIAKLLRNDMGVTTVPFLSWPSRAKKYITRIQERKAVDMRDGLFSEGFHVFQANLDFIHSEEKMRNMSWTEAMKFLQERQAEELFTLFNFWDKGRFTDSNDLRMQFLSGAGYLKVAQEVVGDQEKIEDVVRRAFDQNLYQFEGKVRATAVYFSGNWGNSQVEEMLAAIDDRVTQIGCHEEYRQKQVPPAEDEPNDKPWGLTLFLSSILEAPPAGIAQSGPAGNGTEISASSDHAATNGLPTIHLAPLAANGAPVTAVLTPINAPMKPFRLSAEALRLYSAVYNNTKVLGKVTYGALFSRAIASSGEDARAVVLEGPERYQEYFEEIRFSLGDSKPGEYQEIPDWDTLEAALLLHRKTVSAAQDSSLPKAWWQRRYLGVSEKAWKLVVKYHPAQLFAKEDTFERITITAILQSAVKGLPVPSNFIEAAHPQAAEELLRLYRRSLGEGIDQPYAIAHECSTRGVTHLFALLHRSRSLSEEWIKFHFESFHAEKKPFPGFTAKFKGGRFTFSVGVGAGDAQAYLNSQTLGDTSPDAMYVQECLDLMSLHGPRYPELWFVPPSHEPDHAEAPKPPGVWRALRRRASDAWNAVV